MNAPRTLRCAMKMRTCGLFGETMLLIPNVLDKLDVTHFALLDRRHKAVVSLTFPPRQPFSPLPQGRLTIARSTIFGGKIAISLGNNSQAVSLLPVSGKDARRYQIAIRCGPCQRVTLRAPTRAIYETWWAALQSALTLPTFVVIPCVDTPIQLETVVLAPVHPARRNAVRPKHTATLEPLSEVEHEDDMEDDVPILEAGGRTSPTEPDILASWRTWGSLDYFAAQPSVSSSRIADDSLELAVSSNASADDDSSSSRNSKNTSIDSDVSEYWLKPSELQDELLQHELTTNTNIAPREVELPMPQNEAAPQPQDEMWLEEIADFMFHQKTVPPFKSRQRPKRPITGQLHPLLTYAMM